MYMKRFRCLLCGRDKFTEKSPHNCVGGYRKRGLKWESFEAIPFDISKHVKSVMNIAGRGDVHLVNGLRKDYHVGMIVRYQEDDYKINGIELAGVDRGVPEDMGLLLLRKKHSPIPERYPDNLEECLAILSKGRYKSHDFPYVFLDYNYTNGTWGVTFRNPANFNNPDIAEPTPLKAVHKMFDFLKTREIS